MDRNKVGQAGLSGWRNTVADKVATPVARRSHLSEDDVRAAVGAVFLVLTLSYLVGVIRRIARDR